MRYAIEFEIIRFDGINVPVLVSPFGTNYYYYFWPFDKIIRSNKGLDSTEDKSCFFYLNYIDFDKFKRSDINYFEFIFPESSSSELKIISIKPTLELPSISFCFDDGLETVYKNAFPLFQRYGFNATVGVMSEYYDSKYSNLRPSYMNENLMTLDELLELKMHGWELVAHGGSSHLNKSSSEVNDLLKLHQESFYKLFGEISSIYIYPGGIISNHSYRLLSGNDFKYARTTCGNLFGSDLIDKNPFRIHGEPYAGTSNNFDNKYEHLINDISNFGGIISFFTHNVYDSESVIDMTNSCDIVALEKLLIHLSSLKITIESIANQCNKLTSL